MYAIDHRQLDDAALLKAVLARDEAAWRELIRRYGALMVRCISKVASRYRALSSDAVGEIFSDLTVNLLRDDMRRLRAFDPARGAKLGSWLGLLAIHTSYDFLRQLARRPMLDRLERSIDRPQASPTALEQLIEEERWSHLRRLVTGLSAKDRRFVELYYGDSLQPEQVASAMTISVKTVYSKKNKLQRKLLRLAARGGRAA
jgi:RNA polymerase sigma-70 factor (ECF subfamily)